MEILVKRAGMQTTVQDLGRTGYRADGVPLSGAMDPFALRLANLLVGNLENTAALEFTLLGPELEFSHDTLIALTGGNFGDLPMWQPVRVPAHTVIRLSAAREGCRGYLAVAGGFQVSGVMTSASTFIRGNFGGHEGRALREGDLLHARDIVRHVADHWRVDPHILPSYSSAPQVRVVRGAQASEFGRTFFESSYAVTAQSDRMGFRLKGATLLRRSTAELRSATVVPGTIQVPADGQPIVLMADAQTIGGYPQIAHIVNIDLPLVAQLRPGDTLTVVEVSTEQAHELALARERAVAMLRHGLAQKLTCNELST
jgi:antagonist of KipI